MKRPNRRSTMEFVKFVAVGGVSFVTHYALYMVLTHLGVNATLAYTLGYVSWMVVNFTLSNYFAFHTRPSVKRALGFAISSGIYYLIQPGGFALCRWVGVPNILVTPLVYTIAFPINFVMVRYVLKH